MNNNIVIFYITAYIAIIVDIAKYRDYRRICVYLINIISICDIFFVVLSSIVVYWYYDTSSIVILVVFAFEDKF